MREGGREAGKEEEGQEKGGFGPVEVIVVLHECSLWKE